MKKTLSYILITLILSANFLAPISVGFNKNNIEVRKNKAEATFDNKISLTETPFKTNKTIIIDFRVAYSQIPALLTKQGVRITKIDPVSGATESKIVPDSDFTAGGQDPDGFYIYTGSVLFDNLTPNIAYPITAEARQINTLVPQWLGIKYLYNFSDLWDPKNDTPVDEVVFIVKVNDLVTTNPSDIQTTVKGETKSESTPNNNMPACNIASLMGCVAQSFYYVLFVPTSYLFALSGTMFDYTFSYSVQDSSYKSAFVVQGWGIIRDFCNMFFIFIMLYVAIGTILSLHSMKTKETIVNIVIIGLFINFSLFATQLIIDASNITARVFYNSNAITITEKDANGVTNATPGLKVGEGGVIPLSAALVNKVNPQNLIMNSDKINSIKNNTGSNIVEDSSSKTLSIGQFILIIIMTSAVNIVGFTVFLTIAFLFIARVIGLWLAMILSPLAFFTYILPEMAGTKMIGWKHWWEDTLKLAFLAPVFIFFMYLILKFLQADLISDIASKSLSGDGLGYFVAILVPFAFIMLFMIKAKKIAVDMSGEFGELAVKAGSAVGGLALGAATGGAAFAMRGTIGKMGDALAESKFAKTNGRFGRMLGDAGKWTAGKSFDVRSTSLGGDAMKGMGVDAGKAKEGGYAKHKADTQKKREERAKSLEVGHDEKEMHDLHEKEEGLQALKNAKSTELTAVQGKIDAWGFDSREKNERANQLEQELEKAEKAGTATETQRINAKMARDKAISIANDLQAQKDLKDKIRNDTSDGVMTSVSQKAVDVSNDDATIAEDEAITARASVNEAEATLTNIPIIAQAAITKAQNDALAATTKANSDALAATTKANSDAQVATTKANTDAQAAITKAQNDAKNAEQAKLTAFTRKMENPSSKEASDAYEEAKNNDAIAKTNLISVTNNAPAGAQAIADKAQTDAQAIADKAQADAQVIIDKARTDATAATAKAKTARDIAETIATKKETSATTKRARTTELETAHRDKKKIARSMNDLEFQEVPEAKQVVSTISAGRKNEYATDIKGYWFNKKANAHAAHNIRMNAEIKSDGKVGH